MKIPKLDIYISEYQKIFQILHSIMTYTNGNGPPSCQFYNTTGALILSKIYNIPARPVMGAAFIRTDRIRGNTLAFAKIQDGYCTSNKDHFHCWIETENNVIDFTAPLYSKYPNSFQLARLMFQKPHILMSNSYQELYKPGDFYFERNLELTERNLKKGAESEKNLDFMEIALYWAEASLKTPLKVITIESGNSKGHQEDKFELPLSNIQLVGSW